MFRRDVLDSTDNTEQTDSYKRGLADGDARARAARGEQTVDTSGMSPIEAAIARADAQARIDYQAGPPACSRTRASVNAAKADMHATVDTSGMNAIEAAHARANAAARAEYANQAPACSRTARG